MNTIETKIGIFEVIKDEQQSLNIVDLEKKYVEILNKYEFLVGDYFQENLRLKGFNREILWIIDGSEGYNYFTTTYGKKKKNKVTYIPSSE